MTAPAREGQTFTGESLFTRYVNFVKLPHTLFALPFALVGVVAASFTTPVTVSTLALVVVAFSAARWVAMGFNRIADREYDATVAPDAVLVRVAQHIPAAVESWALAVPQADHAVAIVERSQVVLLAAPDRSGGEFLVETGRVMDLDVALRSAVQSLVESAEW